MTEPIKVNMHIAAFPLFWTSLRCSLCEEHLIGPSAYRALGTIVATPCGLIVTNDLEKRTTFIAEDGDSMLL